MTELAPYAVSDVNTRGRVFDEPAPRSRSQFQRDRDRIIHSSAFRRLEYKTQVFVNHEGDLFRTRLTHSLEVAQIGRTIARSLKLNEDLVEAIALAHDLGHTPFGHAGQDALNACMKEYGGFEHNLQSLRVVDMLEERYAAFDGLNLCLETREGILKHCSIPNAQKLGAVAERFILKQQPTLEAQVANLADEVAYNNHDVDDGLRSKLITVEELTQTAVFQQHLLAVKECYANIPERRLIYETIRSMINEQISDLIEQSTKNISAHNPQSVQDIKIAPALITYSPAMQQQQQELKQFLRRNLYQHYLVTRMTEKAHRIITELFDAFMTEPKLLPPQYLQKAAQDKPRAIADYIAGMTDRYAIKEYRRLFVVEEI